MVLPLGIFFCALIFRLAVGAPVLHGVTVGDLWRYDFNVGLDWAAGYGPVQSAPPALREIGPATVPQSLVALAKPFDPLRYPRVPYPTTIRTAAYASLTALAMKATGTTSVRPLIDLQIILDSLVSVFVFAILIELTSPLLALAGAALSVFWFPEAASSSVYTATALVPFLLTLTLWLYLRGARSLRVWWFVSVGLTSTALVYLRAEMLILPMLLSAYLFVLLRQKRMRTLFLALVPVVIVAIGVLLWSARNGVKTGHYSFSSQTGAALWEGMGYQSGLFPEYAGLYNDNKIVELLGTRGISLASTAGHFYDGPQGMEASAQLTRLFIREVVKAHPAKLVAHLVFKLNENLLDLRNWQDAVTQFVEPRRAPYAAIFARWIDFAVLLLPFICLARIDWNDPHHRAIGIFLIPLLAMDLSLALTVSGPLRYSVFVSPCYAVLGIATVWLLTGGTSQTRKGFASGATVAAASGAAVLAMVVMSFWWPSAPEASPTLALDLMPMESSKKVAMVNGSGVMLAPNRSSTAEKNFATGARVEFAPAPYYPGITGPDDAIQLTDGIVDPAGKYTSPEWVGWGMNAPAVFITIPMSQPHFVRLVRVHTIQGGFPVSTIELWERSGSQRTLLATAVPPSSKAWTDWIELPIGKSVVLPIIGLYPTNVNDRYIFVDEIQVLGTEGYESEGEWVSAPVRLTQRAPGVPVAQGGFPSGSTAELSYRLAGTEPWLNSGWNAAFFKEPVQFRIVLKASADGALTPVVKTLRFEVR